MKKQSVVILILTIVATIFLLGAAPKISMPKWEYTVVQGVPAANELEEKQNGWGFVGFSVDQGTQYLLFKRQKPH